MFSPWLPIFLDFIWRSDSSYIAMLHSNLVQAVQLWCMYTSPGSVLLLKVSPTKGYFKDVLVYLSWTYIFGVKHTLFMNVCVSHWSLSHRANSSEILPTYDFIAEPEKFSNNQFKPQRVKAGRELESWRDVTFGFFAFELREGCCESFKRWNNTILHLQNKSNS